MRMPCSCAGSQSLKASQTHCLLQIQLSSTERQKKRDGERENTEISLQVGIQERKVDKKESMIWLLCLKKKKKREVHGERRDVARPSGALAPSFHVQSRLPCDFQWEKWTHWCIALISFNIERNEKKNYQRVATGKVEVGGSWGKHGAVSSLRWMEWEWEISREPSTHYSTYYSFSTIPLHLLNASSVVSFFLNMDVIQRSVTNPTERSFPSLHWHCGQHVYLCVFKGLEPSVMEQVQDFSCTISTAVLAVAEMLFSNFCNIKS